VEASAADFDGEVMLMDTAPAAVLGALLDPVVSAHQQVIVCNVGNFHTLAFRLGRAASQASLSITPARSRASNSTGLLRR